MFVSNLTGFHSAFIQNINFVTNILLLTSIWSGKSDWGITCRQNIASFYSVYRFPVKARFRVKSRLYVQYLLKKLSLLAATYYSSMMYVHAYMHYLHVGDISWSPSFQHEIHDKSLSHRISNATPFSSAKEERWNWNEEALTRDSDWTLGAMARLNVTFGQTVWVRPYAAYGPHRW